MPAETKRNDNMSDAEMYNYLCSIAKIEKDLTLVAISYRFKELTEKNKDGI
jgi:hypothetical protein